MADTPNLGVTSQLEESFWYKRAVIYEVHVRAFHDSDGDGTGDFPGLTAKLDYLQDLGVTAVWLLPFYPSPLRDDGYDIADYYDVHPVYGTLGDFRAFLREAHRRGLRVITELVVNHTSDQHPWFQRARRAKPGSRWRNYYVWSNSPEKYKGTRIIFKDTEISNWAWDAVAQQHYWHRFYSHQPDLNFDHPSVQREIYKVMDFWFDLGVDGVRLDAIPYLFEREGTRCENLPETHEFLRRLRAHVDEKYGHRMLLAEANQWPEDAVAYFGAGRGDECHMAFHFPLMPRLFMALRMEDRVPIVEILQQTPAIPETAQWALFLRNHDELTLEMVTDEERDYMYRMYAHLAKARLNLGIRRRLAPLVGNDRKRIELLTALLFSLPGTPVLYYGDEIGMGENIYLGDRNGVRTPMQWSADKNAGFSRANPQSLYLPINLDPENHYEAVNVDVQQRNPHSLLWWMKRLIALRKRWEAFGLGSIDFLHPENRKIFACVRRYHEEIILVVANLSRFVQPVELDLSSYQARVPLELFGRTEFPPISEKPYFLTLGPHTFYWFSLEIKAPAGAELVGPAIGVGSRPVLAAEADWQEIFRGQNALPLERAIQSWLPSRRWFAAKDKGVKSVHVREVIPVPVPGNQNACLVFLEVQHIRTEPEMCLLALACAFGEQADAVSRESSSQVLARLKLSRPNRDGVLYDALANKAFCQTLLGLISSRRGLEGDRGRLLPSHTAILRRLRIEGALTLEPAPSKGEQSNSCVVYGDRLILKLFRRLEIGTNPDLEISRFLTERKFPYAPPLAGALEYRGRSGDTMTLGVLNTFVPGCENAWDLTLDTLSRFQERVRTLPPESRQVPSLPAGSIAKLAAGELPDGAKEMIGTYLERARLLGHRTADLHIMLASDPDDPSFAPELATPDSQRGLFQSMRNLTRLNFQFLSQRLKSLPPEIQPRAQQLLGLEPDIIKRFRAICDRASYGVRIRQHGNYHLGQLIYTGTDFLIIDFEGEPGIALSERRLKRSPLLDVACMIRSFGYAAHASLLKQIEAGALPAAQIALVGEWMRFWQTWSSVAFFKAYRQGLGSTPLLPANEADLVVMLDAYLLHRIVHELGHELATRPEWVMIPLQNLLELANQSSPI